MLLTCILEDNYFYKSFIFLRIMKKEKLLEIEKNMLLAAEKSLSFYLAHPFDARKGIRIWELDFEKRTGINLMNPFYDVARKDVERIDAGRTERYEKLQPIELVQRDIGHIAINNGIISIINGDLSYGTIQEMVYAKILQKLNYLLITNKHENHPWLVYHSTRIFTKKAKLEKFLEDLNAIHR